MPGAHRGGHPWGTQNQGGSLKTAVSEEGPKHIWGASTCWPMYSPATSPYPQVPAQQTLFSGQIPIKFIIGALRPLSGLAKESLQLNPHAHELSLSCGGQVPTTSIALQPDFEQDTYTKAYHALMKSSSMYPSYWSNDLTYRQFVGCSIQLS